MDNERIVITISDHQGLSAVVHATRSEGQWLGREVVTDEVTNEAPSVAYLAHEIASRIYDL